MFGSKTHSCLAAAAFLLMSSNGGAQTSCAGEACRDLRVSFNGCYIATNAGNQKLRVRMGPYGFDLQPGQVHRLMGLNGRCVTSFVGGTTATYPEAAAAERRPSEPRPDAPADLTPIEATVRSGMRDSGDGAEFSRWYSLCSDPLPAGYRIVESYDDIRP